MKLGLLVPQINVKSNVAIDFALNCERIGVDGVFVFDHRRAPKHETSATLALFPTLGAIGQATSSIRLGSCIARVDNLSPEAVIANFEALSAVTNGSTGRPSGGSTGEQQPRLFTGLGFGDRLTAQEDAEAGVARLSWPDRLARLESTCEALSEKSYDVWLASKSTEVGQIAARHDAGVLLWDPPLEYLSGRGGSRFAWAGILDADIESTRRQLRFIRSTGAQWAICGRVGGINKPGVIEALLEASQG